MSADDAMRQAKHPISTVLAGPYGHPFHPMLVAIPIGAWVASLVFDVGSYLVNNPGFLRPGAVWLIAIGVLGALAAATVGFLDLLAIPAGTPAFRTGLTHMGLALVVTAAFAVNLWWRVTRDSIDGAVAAGPLTLSVIGLIMLTVAGYLGGKLAYRYGVRVADEQMQATGFENRLDNHASPSR